MNCINAGNALTGLLSLAVILLLAIAPVSASGKNANFETKMTSAVASDKAPAFVRVPVFFITDRNLLTPKAGSDVIDFGPNRKYVGDCKHDPYMGTAYCVMPNIEGKPLTPDLIKLGWDNADPKEKEGVFKAKLLTGENFDVVEKTFYSNLFQQALAAPDHNIFTFAHGYKNSFGSALHTAAKLSYYAERPFIFYSWPSVCKFRAYTSDENNCEWSQEHYNEMIMQLEKLATTDPSLKIRVMAHSMGTRLVVRACPLLREKPWIVEAALVCPDIDDGLVKHYFRRYGSVKGTAKIRIYMSQRDKALAISQILHGGYNRLGECADSLGDWATTALKGSAALAADTSVDDAKFAELLAKTKSRMQTIDFTNIDSGPIGHKVPAKLVCSMSFTDNPCEGLKLVPEESGQRSKLSHRLSKKLDKIAKLSNPEELSIKGTCLRVVRLDKTYDKQIAKIIAPEVPSP